MDKYKRFCGICSGLLNRKYSLVSTTGQLSTIREALADELNICKEGGSPHVCGSCYRWVLALKMEEDVEAKKYTLRATAMTFYKTDRHTFKSTATLYIVGSSIAC